MLQVSWYREARIELVMYLHAFFDIPNPDQIRNPLPYSHCHDAILCKQNNYHSKTHRLAATF
jgi:hypothetical protein